MTTLPTFTKRDVLRSASHEQTRQFARDLARQLRPLLSEETPDRRPVEVLPVEVTGPFSPGDHGVLRGKTLDALDGDGSMTAGTLDPERLGTPGGPCYVWDLSRTQKVRLGRLMGVATDGLPIYGIDGGRDLFPVALTSDGGATGSASAAATWTYTATHAVTGEALGTELSPAWARSYGDVAAATHGTGYFDDAGDFVLYQADEAPSGQECA